MGIFKSGKIVIVLSGRFAGRKAVVVKAQDEGNADKHFGHCLVAGIDRSPRRVVKAMSKSKIEKRTKIKPFVKILNYNHVMPTRYTVDFDMKKLVLEEGGMNPEKIKDTRKGLKTFFEEKYRNQSTKGDKKANSASYFFTKLRF